MNPRFECELPRAARAELMGTHTLSARHRWSPATLGICGLFLTVALVAIASWLAVSGPVAPNPLVREISQRALARISATPLPDDNDNWNNVCTP
jgi:hypothetical protein